MNTPLTSPSSSLCLAAHVRACRVDDQVILLDLRRNRYLSVGGPAVQALADDVQGWPGYRAPSADHSHDRDRDPKASQPAHRMAQIEPLRTRGLVTLGQGMAQPLPSVEEPTASLGTESSAPSPLCLRVGLGQTLRFLKASIGSALCLRLRSLEAITNRVARAHARVRRTGMVPAASLRVAATYERLRPLALTAEDRCLHDSLALMNFLAAEGASAHWVLGVKTRPFGAHAWVQLGPTVLNDLHEHVRRFTPILVV